MIIFCCIFFSFSTCVRLFAVVFFESENSRGRYQKRFFFFLFFHFFSLYVNIRCPIGCCLLSLWSGDKPSTHRALFRSPFFFLYSTFVVFLYQQACMKLFVYTSYANLSARVYWCDSVIVSIKNEWEFFWFFILLYLCARQFHFSGETNVITTVSAFGENCTVPSVAWIVWWVLNVFHRIKTQNIQKRNRKYYFGTTLFVVDYDESVVLETSIHQNDAK